MFCKKCFYACLATLALYVSGVASPANPGLNEFKQSDGSKILIQQFGDEHYHYTETSDGYLVTGNGEGSFVYVGEDGLPSKFLAKNPEDRSDSEKKFLKTLDQSEARSKHKTLNGNRFPETVGRVSRTGALLRANAKVNAFVKGDRFFPVIVISTADFKGYDSTLFARMFNEKGYKDDGHYGSLKDYFISSSNGLFNPTFDIYPITLPKKFGDYNGESVLVPAALDILVEREDFKARAEKYETVSPFIFMHPLSNDRAQTYNDWYYSHQYALSNFSGRKYSKNGYSFDSYAFVAQHLEYTDDKVNMLGTFAHEFSHVLGLYDLYSTDANGYATIGPNPYDVMALGLRNGDGRYPPTYSAFERESMGWMELDEIVAGDSVYVLNSISSMKAFSITNPQHKDEYYIVEYRPPVGFDSKIGQSTHAGRKGENGVFVWYVDYDAAAFAGNDPNGDVNHARVDVKKVVSKDKDEYKDLAFIRKGGVAEVPGVFHFVLESDDRACFTANSAVELRQCPEEHSAENSSSSSVEESPAPEFSDGGSSSSEKPEEPGSSSAENDESSSSAMLFAELAGTPRFNVRFGSGMLFVEASSAGVKHLKIFDALGNVVKFAVFEESFARVDVRGIAKGRIVARLYVDGKPVSARVLSIC